MAENIETLPVEKFVRSSNLFSFEIHRKLSTSEENLFYSPLSLSSSLAMLYLGAKGITEREIRNVLKYDPNCIAEGFKEIFGICGQSNALDIADAILVQKDFPIRSEYVKILRENFHADARSVDFVGEAEKVKREVNSWVSERTNNNITKLIDFVDPSTCLVLLNAVYFKGKWKHPFEHTVPMAFFNCGEKTSSLSVPMMNLRNETLKFVEMEDEDLRVLELPYEESISMWILLPNQLDGIRTLEETCVNEVLTKAIRCATEQTIHSVFLPKFKFEYSTEISGMLADLGMPSICGEADFGNISERANLRVTEVLHKCVIEVHEQGTEASAATLVGAGGSSRNFGFRKEFIADHPFAFFIIENISKAILFRGRVKKL